MLQLHLFWAHFIRTIHHESCVIWSFWKYVKKNTHIGSWKNYNKPHGFCNVHMCKVLHVVIGTPMCAISWHIKPEFSDYFLFHKRFRGKKEEDVWCFELLIPLKFSVSWELPSTMSAVIGTVGSVDCSRVSIWTSTSPGRKQEVFRLWNPTASVICCFSEKTSCPQMYLFGILQQFWNIQN